MAINEIYKLSRLTEDQLNMLQKILSNIHEQATGLEYSDTEPTEVAYGKFVVYDNGATRRLYVRTGAGTIAYCTLTPA